MPAAAWATVAIAGLIIALLAVALLRVIFHLKYVRDRLGTITVNADTIAQRTSTVGSTVDSVNENLRPVREFTESV